MRTPQQLPYMVGDTDRTLRMVAFIVNLFVLVVAVPSLASSTSWAGLIVLAWGIPMTVISWGVYKGAKANTTAFGLATLLFLNVISGILLLLSRKDR